MIRRQYSDPVVRAPSRIEHREYFDGPTSFIEETPRTARAPRPWPRSPSRSLQVIPVPAKSPRSNRHTSESDGDDSTSDRPYHREGHRLESRGRRARRDHDPRSSRYDGDDEGEVPHQI